MLSCRSAERSNSRILVQAGRHAVRPRVHLQCTLFDLCPGVCACMQHSKLCMPVSHCQPGCNTSSGRSHESCLICFISWHWHPPNDSNHLACGMHEDVLCTRCRPKSVDRVITTCVMQDNDDPQSRYGAQRSGCHSHRSLSSIVLKRL